MKHKRKKFYLISIFIIIFFVFLFRFVFSDITNVFLEKLFLIKDAKLLINSDKYIESLENEIKEFKEISNIKNCVSASVIYRSPLFWYDELTINKGKSDNVKEGNIVINNEGVVGVVSSVLLNTSKISLLTNINNDSKITLSISSENDIVYGILSEYDKIKNEIIISELTKEISFSKNMSVLTTSFTNKFKEGLLIGSVKSIIDDENGLSKKAVVIPSVDYNNIKYVCVIDK